ncbi:serine/threonine-protein kinase ZRK3-like [Citrus sinensis]|uniref:serine/threonine-protein kinase ZRK3-like n=1 Tax=Citrus sinensis TaxID=2711 RepID=UPI002277A97E|nr:serine/threonine-protein kinase ZRK3-like [Citrus sinensis]
MIKIKIKHSVFLINRFAMGSIMRKFKDKTDKRALMTRNGATVLKELIASSHGKYNPYRIFSAKELEIATNNYEEIKIIKQDSTYKLYKGFWQERLISVMRFRESNRDEHGSCINNIVYAAQMSHNHILKLIGCCLETQIPILAFESVEFGNLHDRILSASQPQIEPLLMKHRLKIAMDIAHALAYLHFGFPRPIVYRDFKTAHILFTEENVAKLFDFSLSISIPEGETHITTDTVIGTWGYSAPEYLSTGVFNEKSDVYGFGAFLFELLTGQIISDLLKAAHNLGCPLEEYFKKFIEDNSFTEIVDRIIIQDILCLRKEQQLHAYAQLMSECLKQSPVDRPTMVDVAKKLRQIYCSFMESHES